MTTESIWILSILLIFAGIILVVLLLRMFEPSMRPPKEKIPKKLLDRSPDYYEDENGILTERKKDDLGEIPVLETPEEKRMRIEREMYAEIHGRDAILSNKKWWQRKTISWILVFLWAAIMILVFWLIWGM